MPESMHTTEQYEFWFQSTITPVLQNDLEIFFSSRCTVFGLFQNVNKLKLIFNRQPSEVLHEYYSNKSPVTLVNQTKNSGFLYVTSVDFHPRNRYIINKVSYALGIVCLSQTWRIIFSLFTMPMYLLFWNMERWFDRLILYLVFGA